MIFVPLPFVVALLLLLLLARMARGGGAGRHHALFLALLGGYALQSVLVGLNWGYGVRQVLPVQAVTASLLAPLAFLAFHSLAEPEAAGPEGAGPGLWRWRDLLHLPAPLAVAALFLIDTGPVGPAIVALFLGYGAALLWLARLGPDGLVAARLDGTVRSYRALVVTGGALIASALMDVAISLDLDLAGGRHAPAVVTLGNVLALLLLGAAAAAAESGAAEAGTPEPPEAGLPSSAEAADAPPAASAPVPDGEDHALAAAADALMLRTRLYADGELNLGRLARRLGRPARQVSQAINRVHGLSVSHFVNGYRVREACRLLETTDLPVTRVMLEAGFLTKSNFNREFQRLAGASPSAWRQKARG